MKIHDLEFFLASAEPNVPASRARSLLVRVATASGMEGWGESTLGWRVGELAARREALLPVLAGRSVYDIEELHAIEALSPPPLRAAIEMACWDLLARGLRQPLCNLWGGYYRPRVPVSVRLPSCPPKATAQISRELADQGFYTQTITTSGRPDEDLRSVEAIREMVGDRVELRLDGQGRYDEEMALDIGAGLEFESIQFFMDPLNTPELHALARLGRQTSVPLAAWRGIRGSGDALTAVRWSAAPYLVIDLDHVGGIVPARACAAVAAAGGIIPLLGGRASMGVATAAMLHLAASTASLSAAHELASPQHRETVLVDSFEMADGMVLVPQAHGLGVEVDRVKLERYQPVM